NKYSTLNTGKTFLNWDSCKSFLQKWAKKQDFHVVKDQMYQENGVVR
ncbi:6730_t:CDS:1, partial [Scutellospora calospora]